MNVNLYLPDDLGKEAKDAELPLSRLLQDAVSDELERRNAMSETLEDTTTHELSLEDEEGRNYTARITGTDIARNDDQDVDVYLTERENVVVHDGDKLRYWVLNDPENDLRGWLSPADYTDAMLALGITPVIDLDI
jgi:post-segregation antitoxin (ccd killing protein)